jgi:hypothetical protein
MLSIAIGTDLTGTCIGADVFCSGNVKDDATAPEDATSGAVDFEDVLGCQISY